MTNRENRMARDVSRYIHQTYGQSWDGVASAKLLGNLYKRYGRARVKRIVFAYFASMPQIEARVSA